jgi:TetR/AcrR family transcriptional regulator, cholesterol catabolism regulator
MQICVHQTIGSSGNLTHVTTEPTVLKASARREELLRVAARIFADQGYASTTTRDIAVGAKITSGSLYHHFDSKDAMLDIIMQPYFTEFGELLGEIEAEPRQAVETAGRLIRDTLLLSARYRDAALIYSHDGVILRPMFPYVVDTMDRLERLWMDTLGSGVEDGSFAHDLDPGIVYRTIIGATTYTTQWFRGDGALTIEQVAYVQTRLILQGLTAGRPPAKSLTHSVSGPIADMPITETPMTETVHTAHRSNADEAGSVSVVIAATAGGPPSAATIDAAVNALRALVGRDDLLKTTPNAG